MAQFVFRGLGIFMGGFVRDLALLGSGSLAVAYATVFLLEAVGLAVCAWLIVRVAVPGFARASTAPPAPAATLATAVE